ncbi:MAG: hypothetical protein K0R54_3136 [Clostridiaceae bacterium]|nr:hypothetical protein [Clostridiaceae bacterium]
MNLLNKYHTVEYKITNVTKNLTSSNTHILNFVIVKLRNKPRIYHICADFY